MRFEVIGMQFDKPGQQQVASQIDAAFRRVALAEFGNRAAGDGEPAALDYSIGEHNPGIR
jgi:hypothetical protein